MIQIYKSFDSVGAFSAYLNAGQTQPAFKYSESSQYTDSYKVRHCLTADYKEADNLFLYGDKKLMKKIEEAGVYTTRLKLKAQAAKRQIYSSVVGVAPNVPNALAGIPTAMINVREVRAKQRVVNVCYCCSAAANVDANDIIKVAAQFISACMLIEANGVRVNIYLSEISEKASDERGKKDTTAFLVRIKSAAQPFDVLKMAYPLAHPSMLRRHFFRAMEVTEGVPSSFAGGYGAVIMDKKRQMKALGRDAAKINKILSYYDCDGRSAEDIAKMITEEA